MPVDGVIPRDHSLHDLEQVLLRLPAVNDYRLAMPNSRGQLVVEDLSLPDLVRVPAFCCRIIQAHLSPSNDSGEVDEALQYVLFNPQVVFLGEVGVAPESSPNLGVTLEGRPGAAVVGGPAPIRDSADKVGRKREWMHCRQICQRPELPPTKVSPLDELRAQKLAVSMRVEAWHPPSTSSPLRRLPHSVDRQHHPTWQEK